MRPCPRDLKYRAVDVAAIRHVRDCTNQAYRRLVDSFQLAGCSSLAARPCQAQAHHTPSAVEIVDVAVAAADTEAGSFVASWAAYQTELEVVAGPPPVVLAPTDLL